jgi:hypothetical protein
MIPASTQTPTSTSLVTIWLIRSLNLSSPTTTPVSTTAATLVGVVDIGEAPCVPLTSTTSMGRIDEANELAEQDSIEAQLEALREEESETVTLDDDTEVQVGQIVMFVEREERLLIVLHSLRSVS